MWLQRMCSSIFSFLICNTLIGVNFPLNNQLNIIQTILLVILLFAILFILGISIYFMFFVSSGQKNLLLRNSKLITSIFFLLIATGMIIIGSLFIDLILSQSMLKTFLRFIIVKKWIIAGLRFISWPIILSELIGGAFVNEFIKHLQRTTIQDCN